MAMESKKSPVLQYQSNNQPEEKKPKKLACRRCRHRKQKCDNVQPKCGNCTKSGEECLPTKRATSKADYPARYVVALEEHVAKLEAQLLVLQPDQRTAETIKSRPQRPGSLGAAALKSTKAPSSLRKGSECSTDSQSDAASSTSDSRIVSNVWGKRREELEPAAETLLEPNARIDMQNDIKSVNSAFQMLYSPLYDLSQAAMPCTPQPLPDMTYNGTSLMAENALLTVGPIARVFANVYFETIQPQYPFLHRATWNLWWTSWMDDELNGISNPSREWRGFFVNMIYSIGSFLLQDNLTDDIPSSTTYHNIATSKYLHHVFQHPSRELHVQALLLLSIHALQSSSNTVLSQLVSSCMQYCISNSFHQTSLSEERTSVLDEETRERIFWSSYALECTVCTALDLPTSLPEELISTPMFESIDDERLQPNGNYPFSYRDGLTASTHMYQLRVTQSGILARHFASPKIHASQIQANVQWMYDTHSKVNEWRRQVSQQADTSINSPMSAHCLEFEAMNTLLLLYRPHKIYLEAEGCEVGERAIKASCAVCLAFRRYGLGRQTSQPWIKILPYFQAGITLIYCLAMTPKERRTPLYEDPVILRAIRACSDILAASCDKWPEAPFYRDVFSILVSMIQNQFTFKMTMAASSKLEYSIAKLTRNGANRWVLNMLHGLAANKPLGTSESRRNYKVTKSNPKKHRTAHRTASIPCSPRTQLSPRNYLGLQQTVATPDSDAFMDLSKFDWNAFMTSTMGTPADAESNEDRALTPPETRDGSFDGSSALGQSMGEPAPDLSGNPCEDLFPSLNSLDHVSEMDDWVNY